MGAVRPLLHRLASVIRRHRKRRITPALAGCLRWEYLDRVVVMQAAVRATIACANTLAHADHQSSDPESVRAFWAACAARQPPKQSHTTDERQWRELTYPGVRRSEDLNQNGANDPHEYHGSYLPHLFRTRS